MARAIELAELCVTEPGKNTASPKVGAVAVAADGTLLAESFRGKRHPGEHAEYGIVAQVAKGSLRGSTIYTTLEPCTTRNPPKVPCAQRLIDEGVVVVWIGMLDPDPRIRELGYAALRGAGIDVRDFSAEFRGAVMRANAGFIEKFVRAVGMSGRVTFDYMQNAGRFSIDVTDEISVDTRWSMAGHGSIHAYTTRSGTIAISKTAITFDDIDDPGMYEFEGHTQHVHEGQIVIFKASKGYLLVRVDRVLAGPERGDPHTELGITYEFRAELEQEP